MKNFIQAKMSYKMSKFSTSFDTFQYKTGYAGRGFSRSIRYAVVLALLMMSMGILNAQSAIVLPTDGTNGKTLAPQGALRYQRGFYLITPKEIQASGLLANDTINCIGFTIGAAQNDTTRGKFKVYLQNTTDTLSRVDTTWTTVTGILNNYYNVTGLFPGIFEWQVKTNCSVYSPLNSFTTDLEPCQPPTRLTTDSITDIKARFNWIAPATGVIKYYVEYKKSDAVNWILDSTTLQSYTVNTLIANSGYQWRVTTKCASGNSDAVDAEFTTEKMDNCNEASALLNSTITDTMAILKWTAAIGATYHTVRFRRVGDANWFEALSFTDSVVINFGLIAGTLYEWQVAANCGISDLGSYVKGNKFLTAGTVVCYTPDHFSADNLTATTSVLTWDTVPFATSYDLRFRAKDVISWTNATTPMSLVHNDSIVIPDTIGPYTVPFKGASIDTFVYSGNGVYVAWEYQDSAGLLSSPNTTLTTTAKSVLIGSYGQDSIRYILSFISLGDSTAIGLDSILNVTRFRPETRLCSSSLRDSVEVLAVYALGKYAPFYTSSPVSAVIRNYSGSTQTYPVTMMVKDQKTNAIRYTDMQNIMIAPDTSGLIVFNGWTPSLLETDSIIISVPTQTGENVVNNNRNHYIQMITKTIVSFEDGSNSITGAGTDTSAGLTLSRHLMDGCGKINSVQVFLSESAQGHSVFAIALDTNNVILAQSSAFTPDSSQVNQYHTFFFNNTRLLKDEEYYVGLAQTASAQGYFPVGVQWEGGKIRDSTYYRGRIAGDSIWHQPYPGRLMIRAVLVPGAAAPTITGDLFLCTSTTDTLVASSVLPRYADSVIAFSSQNGVSQYSAYEALGPPDVFPGYGADPAAWLSDDEDGREYLVLGFSNPDSVNFVDIFETLNPGSIDSIYLKDDGTGLYNLIWSGTAAPLAQSARKNRITFPLTPYKVSAVRIAFNMDTVPGFSAVDAVCIGRITTPGIFSSISWTGGSSNDTLFVTAPGGYKLTTIDANGCSNSDSVTVITPVTITPTIIVTGPTTFCPGDSIKLKSSQIGGNVWSTGATTDSIYVKAAGSYFVMYNDGSGCGITMSTSVVVSLFTPPVVNITGPTVICPNSFVKLKATPGFNSYFWSTTSSADSIQVYLLGVYTVTITDANGCKAADTVTTTAGSYPAPNISGTLLFCPGDSTTLTASAGFSSFLWSTGANTDTIHVKTAGTFTVTVTNADGCIGSNIESTSLYLSPTAMISSNNGFCPSDSVKLTAGGGISYLWSTGSTANSIYVNTTGNYILTSTDINGCQDTVSKSIIQYTPPTPFISGTLSFCAGGSVTTLNAGQGYSNYLWSTGETSPAILVGTVNTFSVTVTDINGCKGSAMATTSLDGGVPEVPGPISGSLFGMCNAMSPVTYSISPVSNSTCYVWIVPDGATIVSGYMEDSSVFFNTIQVVFDNSFTGGYIEVAAHNDCGSSPSFNGRRILISASPGSVPGTISGTTSGVCKLQIVTYTLPPIVGATSYLWTVPLGADIINGQGTNSITINFASSYRTGDICVQYTTVCGTSPFECISVSPQPKVNGTIVGPTTLCALANNIIYSIPLSAGATAYEWTVPTGATILSGQGTNLIKVAFGTHSGIVTVIATNACGNSTNQFITVNLVVCGQSQLSQLGLESSTDGKIKIKVFPNPSEGILHLNVLTTDLNIFHELSITDAMGRLVYTTTLRGSRQELFTLDLRTLNKGIFVLNLKNESNIVATKIVLR